MKLIAATAAILMTTASAYAADAIVYSEPAPVEVVDTFSWTGGYIGVNAGYAGGKAKTNYTEIFDNGYSTETINFSDNASGFIGGVQAGYNWQMDQFILGLETDIQASAIEAKFSVNDYTVANTKIDWFGTTRVRLGYTPVDRFMVYATGGVAYGKIKHNMSLEYGDVSASDTRVGYTVGAGAEYAITNNVTLKTEYLYTDLGKLKLGQSNEVDYDGDYSASGEVKLPFHTVRIGVNYKF